MKALETSKENIDTARFTVVIPMELSIRMDIAREKNKTTKSNWLIEAITDKLDKEDREKTILEEIKNEINELKQLIITK